MGRFLEAKNLNFRTFFDVFSKSFSQHAWEGQKIDPRGPTRRRRWIFGLGFRLSPPSWGEKKRGDHEPGLASELDLSDSPSVIELGVSESDDAEYPARPAHLRWAAD